MPAASFFITGYIFYFIPCLETFSCPFFRVFLSFYGVLAAEMKEFLADFSCLRRNSGGFSHIVLAKIGLKSDSKKARKWGFC